MPVSTTWDEYAFRNHKFVVVDPWTPKEELGLLFVFTKVDTYGNLQRGPILRQSGTLRNLAQTTAAAVSSSADGDYWEEVLLSACPPQPLPSLVANVKSTAKVSASVLKILGADSSDDINFFVKVEGVRSESVEQSLLTRILSEGKWKPDMNSPHLPPNWDGVLWVVTEIIYAKSFIIGDTVKAVAKVATSTAVLTPLAGLPVELDGRFELLEGADRTKVCRTMNDSQLPIGFKCIRLEFDEDGNLQGRGGIKNNTGSRSPQLRADTRDWLNPNSDPAYHMGELFTDDSSNRRSLPIYRC